MTDDELRAAYGRHVASAAGARRKGCPSPEALRELVERRGPEADRLAVLDHAMACDACRRDLELLRAVTRAGESTGGARVRWRSWGSFRTLAAAAVLLLTIGTVTRIMLRPARGPVLRGGSTDVTLVSPAGAVNGGGPITFTWRPALGALTYQMELLDQAGDSVYAAATGDTVFALPPMITLVGGREYLWSVRSMLRDGTQATSGPVRFHVIQP